MDVMTAFAFCMVLLLVLLLVGVPLPYCFAGALIFMVATCGIPIKSLFVWGYSQMISTSLMAVPMFIIAGNLIAESSIAEKLVDLARIFVGKVKGALGCICVVVCGIMGAISGSAFTGIAALGSIMIPELQKEGYSRGFATSLVTCSSILGTLIPPSIPIIVLGWTTGISILGCFMATVVPGIITILTFSAINVFYARRYAKKENAEAIEGQVTKAKPKASRAFVEAIPALLLPVIILGGIYGGFFTATEAAGVCSVLALLLGALVYRQLKVKNTMDMLKTTASSIGSIFMMIFFCLLLSQCMTQLKIPQMLVDIFLGFTNNKFVVLIMVNVFLLFVGMIVNDTTAIMLGSYANMGFLDFFWYKGRPSIFFAVELGAILSAFILAFLFRKEKKLRKALTVILQLLNSHLIISILWQHRQWIFSVHWTGWTASVFQEPMLTDGISTRLRKHWKMEVFLLLVSTVHRITN